MDRFLGVFLELVGCRLQSDGGRITPEWLREKVYSTEALAFFSARGIERDLVTTKNLQDAAVRAGLLPVKHQRSFSEMQEVIAQHREGLVHDSELILALQCSPYQVELLLKALALPPKFTRLDQLSLLDDQVDDRYAKDLLI